MGNDAPRMQAAAAALAELATTCAPLDAAAAAAGAHGAAAAATASPLDAQQGPAEGALAAAAAVSAGGAGAGGNASSPSPPEQAGAGSSAPPPAGALAGPQAKKRKLYDAHGNASTPWSPGSKATKNHCAELGLLLHLKLTSISGREIAEIVRVSHGTIHNHAKKWAELGGSAENAALHAAAGANFKMVWARALPKMFGTTTNNNPAAAAPAVAPFVYDACFDAYVGTKADLTGVTASRRKGVMRTAMMQYRNRQLIEGKRCSWPDAFEATRDAFRAKGFPAVKVSIKHVAQLAKRGLPGDRLLGRATAVPLVLETELAWVVDHVRSKCGTMDKDMIMSQMTKSLQALGDSNPYPNGVTDDWYGRFLIRHGLESFNEVHLDVNRANYLQAENLFQAYRNLFELAVSFRIADNNLAYKNPQDTPGVEVIFWKKDQLWRILEFDEAGIDVGIKTAETPHTSTDKQVRRKGSKNAEVVCDGVPKSRASAIKCINFAGDNLPDGFVFDLGEGANLGKHGLRDDDGTLLEFPVTDGKGGTWLREPYMSSNEKGSFDADKLVEYLDFVVKEHELIGRHFTAEQPGIAFIDGCQTHLSKKVVEWCVAHHIHILLKLPYGSSLMQTMDCHGGHFSRVKPTYRRQVRRRTFRLLIEYCNATELQRAAGVGQGGKLLMKDFVPMIKAAWLDICKPEVHIKTLQTCGYVPFTMKPAYDLQKKEEARRVEGLGVPRPHISDALTAKAVAALELSVMETLKHTGRAPKGTKEKAEAILAKRAALVVAAPVQPGGAAAAVPVEPSAAAATTAATAARLAVEISAITEYTDVFEGSKDVAARVMAAGNFTKEDDAGDAAAKEVVAVYPGLRGDVRAELLRLACVKGWALQRSGAVFTHFGAIPTASKHLCWMAAVEARKAATKLFKSGKSETRAVASGAKDSSEGELSAAAVAEMKTMQWDMIQIATMTNAKLTAVLRHKFGLKDVKRAGVAKAALLQKLAPLVAPKRKKVVEEEEQQKEEEKEEQGQDEEADGPSQEKRVRMGADDDDDDEDDDE